MGPLARRRFGLAALSVLTLMSVAPIVSLTLAATLAASLGCTLDEGGVHPCRVAGVDIGDLLYTGAVLGWLMLVTWPGMLVSLGVWIGLIARRILRHRRSQSYAPERHEPHTLLKSATNRNLRDIQRRRAAPIIERSQGDRPRWVS